MAEGGGWFKAEREDDRFLVAAGGRWTTATLAALDAPLRALEAGAAHAVAIDLGEIEALDTAGAWLLHRTLKQLAREGIAASFARTRPEYETLLEQAAHADRPHPPEAPAGHPIINMLVRLGVGAFALRDVAAGLLSFFGLLWLSIARSMLKPARIRFVSVVSHMERTGLDAHADRRPLELPHRRGDRLSGGGPAEKIRRRGLRRQPPRHLDLARDGHSTDRDHRGRPLGQRVHRRDRHHEGERGGRRDDHARPRSHRGAGDAAHARARVDPAAAHFLRRHHGPRRRLPHGHLHARSHCRPVPQAASDLRRDRAFLGRHVQVPRVRLRDRHGRLL